MLLAHAAQATSLTLNPGPSSSGTYTANVSWTGTTFTITGVTAGTTPNSTGDAVRVYFLDGSNNFVAGTGSSNGGTDGSNWGGFYNIVPSAGVVYSQWDTIANQSNALDVAGTKTFTQTGALTATGAVSGVIEVLGQNGLTWTAQLAPPQVIPEGSSLAMLLPGLVPLGMVLRRRASRK